MKRASVMALLQSTKLAEALARVTELEGQFALAVKAAETFEAKISGLNQAALDLAAAHTAAIEAKDGEILELTGKLETATKDVETKISEGIASGIAAAGVAPIERDPKAVEKDAKGPVAENLTGLAKARAALAQRLPDAK